jgi:N-acyl-L-homoserine lactone synthetase
VPDPIDRPRPGAGRAPSGEAGAGEDRLSLGDDLAATILEELQPLRFGEAEDLCEREACFRLRYRAVLEMGMAAAEQFPDGLEHDEFDAGAVQILGRDQVNIIATGRLVLPKSGGRLPAEQEFGLRLAGGLDVVELGRVVVDPGYRGDGHSVFMGLAAQAWLSMRARGFTAAIAATTQRMIRLLEAIGFTVTVLGPPLPYWGEERYPIICDGRPAIPGIERHWLAGGTDVPPV